MKMIKLIYKKIFIPKYILKKAKLSINTIKIYYGYLIIIPFLTWRFLELYIGNRYFTVSINVRKVGFRLKDFIGLNYKKNLFK